MLLNFRSTRDQHGNFIPTLTTVYLYRLLQLDIFVISPFTPKPTVLDAGIQDIVPSRAALPIILIAAIAAQSLPPFDYTVSFSLLSLSNVHVPRHHFICYDTDYFSFDPELVR